MFASSHADLPPTLIQIADLDAIRDDGSRYAAKLEAAGVTVTLTNYKHTPHSHASLPGVIGAANLALKEVIAYLRAKLIDN
jgi:acetyl esterase